MSFDFKNASVKELKVKYNEMARAIGDDQFFTKKELYSLPEVLQDGEQVLAFTSGMKDNNTWLVTLTDRRIIFLDKGMFWGLKQESISLSKINSIYSKMGLMFGEIVISTGSTHSSVTMIAKSAVSGFTNIAQEAIRSFENRGKKPVQGDLAGVDKVSRIRELKKLLDEQLITQEEFNVEKAKVLASN